VFELQCPRCAVYIEFERLLIWCCLQQAFGLQCPRCAVYIEFERLLIWCCLQLVFGLQCPRCSVYITTFFFGKLHFEMKDLVMTGEVLLSTRFFEYNLRNKRVIVL
jgi:hypothetical protein